MINRSQRNQNLLMEQIKKGVNMLRNRLQHSLSLQVIQILFFPEKASQGGQHAPKSLDNMLVPLSFCDFQENTVGKNTSILISGGQHPPYCHAFLHAIPNTNFKILPVSGGQHGPCYPILHYRFSKLPLPREEWETNEYEQYINALHSNQDFYEWTLIEKFKDNDFDYGNFCCLEMAEKIFDSLDENGQIKHDDMDVVVNKWEDGTFGLPIHDGGTSMIEIKFCPWCGENLKK